MCSALNSSLFHNRSLNSTPFLFHKAINVCCDFQIFTSGLNVIASFACFYVVYPFHYLKMELSTSVIISIEINEIS